MSSRQLRKLQKQKELEQAQDLAAQDSEESDAGPAPTVAKPRVSLFAALGGDDEDEARDESDDEAQNESPQVVETVNEVLPASSGKSKKKKKNKKKAKAKITAPDVVEEDGDEIDKAIKELNMNAGSKHDASADTNISGPSTWRINELLTINPYHLKAVNEMRNLFGRDVIESAEAEEEQERRQQRRGPVQQQVDLETFLRSPPGAQKLPEVSIRRNIFIQGREHWPRQSAGGLTMREVGKAPDGSWTEYAYVHDASYDAVQTFFFGCVQIGDPMRMVHLLKEVPYHVSTLLQVSSVAKQDQNMALAAELCERALFTFGRVTTSAFRQNIEQGKARLDFRRPENRQFWLAGYHYLKSLIRKGTYRTALEWAKLLYGLDPQDPYAMRHFIHLLAVRAHESRWLIDFMDEIEKTTINRDTIYLRQTQVLAKLQLGDTEGARQELEAGFRRVPWLYCALFQELGLDTPPSIWGINADSNARSFWVKLYIYQTKELWNNAQATGLLQNVAKSLEKVDTSILPSHDAPADIGATRLAYLEGQTSLMAVAPRELLDMQPNYEFDPLPPPQDENIFTTQGVQLPWLERRQNAETQTSEIEQRMRNMFARHGAGAGLGGVAGAGAGLGGVAGAGADSDEDNDEELAAMLDDQELQRDLEEHARAGNEAGLFARLVQMLGVGTGPADEGGQQNQAPEDNGREDTVDQSDQQDSEGVPGAWPDEEEGSRGRR